MKAGDLVKALIKYNPEAEMMVSIKGVEHPVEGILELVIDDSGIADRTKMETGKVTLKLAGSKEPDKQDPVYDQVLEEMSYILGCGKNQISPDMRFRDDLHMDTLDIFEMTSVVEEHLDVKLPDFSVLTHPTVQSLADLVKTKLKEKM